MAIHGYSIIGTGSGSAVILPPAGADIAGFLVWLYHVAPGAEESICVQDTKSGCGLLFKRKEGSFSHGIPAEWLALEPRHILAAGTGGCMRIFITADARESTPVAGTPSIHMDRDGLHWAEGKGSYLDSLLGMPFPLTEWDSPAAQGSGRETA